MRIIDARACRINAAFRNRAKCRIDADARNSIAPPRCLKTFFRLPSPDYFRYFDSMLNRRWGPVWLAGLVVLGIWAVALAGYSVAKNRRVTVERVKSYVQSVDLGKLSGNERARAIRRLAEMLNALSIEERQKARLERLSWSWLGQMTEDEKTGFIEATMPTGFKQMLASFEQLPEDKRRKTVDDALRRLRESQARFQAATADDGEPGTNGPPVISEELQAKIRTIGLKTFYSQSSAQTKAELAPVLEELQHVMESGRPFRER